MFKARHFVIATFAMVCAASAFAGGQDKDKGQGNGQVFAVSWEDFKGRCANPDSYQNQREPRQIKIQCTNVEHEFVPEAPGTVDLAGQRQVITTVLSDKFNVASMDKGYALATKPGSCLRYKEIEKTITIERPMTCGEILSIKGDVSDFCAGNLDTAKSVNPKMIDVRDTGNRIDTCGGVAGGGKGNGK